MATSFSDGGDLLGNGVVTSLVMVLTVDFLVYGVDLLGDGDDRLGDGGEILGEGVMKCQMS